MAAMIATTSKLKTLAVLSPMLHPIHDTAVEFKISLMSFQSFLVYGPSSHTVFTCMKTHPLETTVELTYEFSLGC